MRSGRADDGTKHSEKCRKRIENEMRRVDDPRIKQSEDRYTAYEEEIMRARNALHAKAQAAVHGRRGGVGVGGSGDGAGDQVRAEDQGRDEAEDSARREGTDGKDQAQRKEDEPQGQGDDKE